MKKMWPMFCAFTMILTLLLTTGGVLYPKAVEVPSDLIAKRSSIYQIEDQRKRLKIGPGETFFQGAEVTLLSNQGASQMLSMVIQSKGGSVIVIDGGTPEDAPYLTQQLLKKGGKVAAWFVTHPHSDHIGALTQILNDKTSPITIENVYYSLTDQAWYDTHESYRADTVLNFRQAVEGLPEERRHGNLKTNQEIWVDDIKVVVVNEPYLFETNSINNSSVAFKFFIDGVSLLVLGDMGPDAGARLLKETPSFVLESDMVQMAHHGQYGVNQDVYQAIKPQVCLWPTPGWLWDNDSGGGPNSGSWTTLETRRWMNELSVKANYSIKDGDQVLR